MGKGILGALPAVVIATACSGNAFVIEGTTDAGASDAGLEGGSTSDASADGGSGGDGSVTADQACADVIGSLCSKLEACAPFLIQTEFGDAASCKRRDQLLCRSLLASGPGAGASNLEACAQAYAAASCDEIVSNKTPGVCDFHGSVAPGGACAETAQCSAGNYCNVALGMGCGVCAPRLRTGATCSADADCLAGVVCAKAGNAATGSCTVPGTQGAACDATHVCLATLACAAGTCTATLGAGAPCSTTQPCDFLHGLYCNRTNVCAQIQTPAAGAPCGLFANGTFAVCVASGKCKMADGAATGTCEAPAADGVARCDAINGPPCLAPAACVNGACTLPDPAACH
jgi:hypothetical protein